MTMAPEVWLALGYAGFLLAASSGLAWLGRRTERGPRPSWMGRRGQIDLAADGEAPWPHSDAARFVRALSRVLMVLAVFVLSVAFVRHPPNRALLLGALLVVVSLARATRHARGRPRLF